MALVKGCGPDGLCKGRRTTPICAYPRTGDGQGWTCRVSIPYPPPEVPVELLANAWRNATTQVLVKEAEGVAEGEIQEEVQRSTVFSPDWRFWTGLALMTASGGYFLGKKFSRKRR